jgi:hypothetical protein
MKFENVSIIIPTMNETFSFEQTVDIVLNKCDVADLREIIAIVCDRTTAESLSAIEATKAKSEAAGVPLTVLWQTLPFAGGASRDGMDLASGSHTLMMSADLETDPNIAPEFIKMAKQFPGDMTTASRWV